MKLPDDALLESLLGRLCHFKWKNPDGSHGWVYGTLFQYSAENIQVCLYEDGRIFHVPRHKDTQLQIKEMKGKRGVLK